MAVQLSKIMKSEDKFIVVCIPIVSILHSKHESFRNVMTTYGRYPLTVSYGKGSKLYDESGNEYLDFTAGIATCCLGHSHPKLKAAVAAQMDRVHHCSNLYFIPEQGKLAKWLVANSCADKVFLIVRSFVFRLTSPLALSLSFSPTLGRYSSVIPALKQTKLLSNLLENMLTPSVI